MKAFALQSIQRGKDAEPRNIAAGDVFDATDDELLHLTPMGAIRKPTSEELAIARWKWAEEEDQSFEDAKLRVIKEFAEPERASAAKVERASGKKAAAKAEAKAESQPANQTPGNSADDGLGV